MASLECSPYVYWPTWERLNTYVPKSLLVIKIWKNNIDLCNAFTPQIKGILSVTNVMLAVLTTSMQLSQ